MATDPAPHPPSRPSTRLGKLRQRLASRSIAGTFAGLARLGRRAPQAQPERHGLRVTRDVAYRGDVHPAFTLDIYEPQDLRGPAPTVLYVHGGGFRTLSKDTHWLMGLQFARRGWRVVNVNYRLAPKHPFPAAAEDTCAALLWTLDHAEERGFDPTRLAFAGESAGANLAAMLAIASLWPRDEPWARAVYDRAVVPRVVLPACGILQVHEPERYLRRAGQPVFVRDTIYNTCDGYLPPELPRDGTALASPLTVLEQATAPDRPMPAWFAPCGTNDPLYGDSVRLQEAVTRLGGVAEAPLYHGELHAFHALLWRKAARECWREMLDFTAHHLDPA